MSAGKREALEALANKNLDMHLAQATAVYQSESSYERALDRASKWATIVLALRARAHQEDAR